MSDLETRLSLSFSNFFIGSLIILFSQYIDIFAEPLRQAIEALIGITVIGGYLLTAYGLGGIRYFSANPEASEDDYYFEEGAYILIAGILILILMSLGSILTNLNKFGLGI